MNPLRFVSVVATAILIGGCTARAPALDPATAAQRATGLARATAPADPIQATFDWHLRERDAQVAGRGVARIDAPARARIDLFGPRGDALLAASVVGDRILLPAGAPASMVPPPALLWSALGVFRQPAGASLVAARADEDRLLLEYALGDTVWRFQAAGDRLVRAQLEAGDGVRHVVDLDGTGPLGLPGRAAYRDVGAFRELILVPTKAEHVDGFPSEIWTPAGS